VTDLPSRLTHYPSHGIGSKGPAVILASYTWENDTLVWDSQPEEERLRQVLRNLAAIHGDVVYREAVTGISKSWRQDPYIAGILSYSNPDRSPPWLLIWPHPKAGFISLGSIPPLIAYGLREPWNPVFVRHMKYIAFRGNTGPMGTIGYGWKALLELLSIHRKS
jgi:hypothetical protein